MAELATAAATAPPRRLPFGQLVRATGGFAGANKIGEGATGEVYKGAFEDGTPVAVKVLKLPQGASPEARAELGRRFRAEFDTLSALQHVRLVRLLGWAQDDDPAASKPYALVFEFLEGGSLADRLRGPDGAPPHRGAAAQGKAAGGGGGRGGKEAELSALSRLDIALGLCGGLAFLHGLRDDGGEGGVVLHRDVKAANVGLTADPNLYTKIFDFGLAKVSFLRPC